MMSAEHHICVHTRRNGPLRVTSAIFDSDQSRPLKRSFQTNRTAQGHGGMCHVWTAPRWQGLCARRRSGRSSHVFGLLMRLA